VTLQPNRPTNAKERLDEYERLLAERFTIDPDAPQVLRATAAAAAREARLAELYRTLFADSAEHPQ
jgi:hypothetical protein